MSSRDELEKLSDLQLYIRIVQLFFLGTTPPPQPQPVPPPHHRP